MFPYLSFGWYDSATTASAPAAAGAVIRIFFGGALVSSPAEWRSSRVRTLLALGTSEHKDAPTIYAICEREEEKVQLVCGYCTRTGVRPVSSGRGRMSIGAPGGVTVERE